MVLVFSHLILVILSIAYYLDEVKIVVSAWDCMIMLSLLINFLFNRTPPPSPFAVSRNYYGRPNEKLISGSFLSTKA